MLLKSESLGTDGLGAVKIRAPWEFSEAAKQIVRGNATAEPD